MFTGIIENTGHILSVSPLGEGKEIVVSTPSGFEDIALGESISVNGVCSTVVEKQDTALTFQYLRETLIKTTIDDLKEGQRVNLEKSLTPSTRMGGHFVTGHVDTTGTFRKISRREPWGEIHVAYPLAFRQYLIPKGSVAIDGISLTVVDLTDSFFSCHLIPHTFRETNLSEKHEGDKVNLEFDMIGKYLYRFYSLGRKS